MPVSRRNFIQTGLQTGIGALGLGVLPSQARSANSDLQIGIIGVGRQGMRLLHELISLKHVQVAACCDLDPEALRKGSQWINQNVFITTDYQALLGVPSLDGVIIATPDESHARIASAALAAGKDVYLETPMTRNAEDAAKLAATVTNSRHFVQCASPLLDHVRVQAARTMIHSGQLGRVLQVTVALQTYPTSEAVPEWHRERQTANPVRAFAPYLDIVHRILDLEMPIRASAHGITTEQQGIEQRNPQLFHGVLEYASDLLVNLSFGAISPMFVFHGVRGSFDLHQLSPIDGNSHLIEWLSCIRNRIPPQASVDLGIQHCTALDLLERAYWSGTRQNALL